MCTAFLKTSVAVFSRRGAWLICGTFRMVIRDLGAECLWERRAFYVASVRDREAWIRIDWGLR
jgi:hypothetical protein